MASPFRAPATVDTIHALENGLTVIVREDHSAPVVAVQAWCRTGSIHEGRWLGAGLSHVLEHMLFKGTTRRTGTRLDQEVQAAGGYFNAYTSFDRTVYWINIPSSGAVVAIDILSDIMQHASLPPERLAQELDVIRREMDMNQDDPARRSSRRLFETAYIHSPCRFPVIGRRDLFAQLRPDDIQRYYHERYTPNNTFFVIVGDVTADAVHEQIRVAYAHSPARPLAPVWLPAEPCQISPRETVEEDSIVLGHLHCCWHIPDSRHADNPALDVLSSMLGGGRSSRLPQRMREQLGLVHAISAWTCNPGEAGLLGVSAVLDGARHDSAVETLQTEIHRFQDQGARPAELRRAVKQFTAATLASRKTMHGQAHDLGSSWLLADDIHFSDRYLEAVRRLDRDDLQAVARRYLTESQRTRYALLPRGTRKISQPRSGANRLNPARLISLSNGLRVAFQEDRRLPFIEFRLALRGGVLEEDASNNGLTKLLANCLPKGTHRRSARQIAERIENVGGRLDGFSGNSSYGLQAEVLQPDLRLAVELLSDILLNPTFPDLEVEREREVQRATLLAQEDQMLRSALKRMRLQIFGQQGYGLDPLGSEPSLNQLTPAALRITHRAWTQPSRAVLAVIGPVQEGPLTELLERSLADWNPPAAAAPARPLPTRTLPAGDRRVRELRDKRQAVVVLGFPGTTRGHADQPALDLIQQACSDLGSRLFLRVRERLGLAYHVGAQHFAGPAPGYFAFYAGTAPSQADRVETELLAEAALLSNEGLTIEELERAKAKLIGHQQIARQDAGERAFAMALDELYGLGYAYSDTEEARYREVDLEQIRTVAHRYLAADRAVVTLWLGSEQADQDRALAAAPTAPG
jgi:zinc protease